jgi:hypothetical protein
MPAVQIAEGGTIACTDTRDQLGVTRQMRVVRCRCHSSISSRSLGAAPCGTPPSMLQAAT